MANERRSFGGGAKAATLTAGINSSIATFTVSDASTWPSGSAGDFFAVIDRGTVAEEKVRCQSQASNVVTVRSGGRGADGTTGQSHSAGAVVELCLTATDADEANAHVSNAVGDPHPQYTTAAEVSGIVTTAVGDYLPLSATSAFTRSMLDDASASAVLATLGVRVAAAKVGNAEDTNSETYTNLATSGPAVTLTTGTTALVIVTGTVMAPGFMGYAVSGATTIAAVDTTAISTITTAGEQVSSTKVSWLTTLTAGSNTFTAKYKTFDSGSTIYVGDRELIVVTFG